MRTLLLIFACFLLFGCASKYAGLQKQLDADYAAGKIDANTYYTQSANIQRQRSEAAARANADAAQVGAQTSSNWQAYQAQRSAQQQAAFQQAQQSFQQAPTLQGPQTYNVTTQPGLTPGTSTVTIEPR